MILGLQTKKITEEQYSPLSRELMAVGYVKHDGYLFRNGDVSIILGQNTTFVGIGNNNDEVVPNGHDWKRKITDTLATRLEVEEPEPIPTMTPEHFGDEATEATHLVLKYVTVTCAEDTLGRVVNLKYFRHLIN